MARRPHVFVSYSRVQFYFAEDLALALGQRGFDAWFDVHRVQPGNDWNEAIASAVQDADAVVLVASKDALASPHVQAELAVARAADIPVFVAVTEPVELPASLEAAPRIDVRQGFERKLDRLVAALNGDALPSASSGQAAVVRAIPAFLLAAAALFGALTLYSLNQTPPDPVLGLITTVGAAYCAWVAWEVGHRRRKPVRRLFAALVVNALSSAFALVVTMLVLVAFGSGVLATIAMEALWGAATIAFAAWLGTSPAFYRWCPTGAAPRRMRRRRLARRGFQGLSAPRAAGAITYALHCDGPDATVERALDAELQACGHRRVAADGADRQILVLSDLTPLAWLRQTLLRLSGPVIVVISAPVSLDELGSVERYQWVDHRRRRRRTLAGLAASISTTRAAAGAELVPESLRTRVLPPAIFFLCSGTAFAVAYTLATAIAIAAGLEIAGELSPAVSLPALFVTVAVAVLAATLVATRRTTPRAYLALYAATSTGAAVYFQLQYPGDALWLLASVALSGLCVAAVWRPLVDWLPRQRVDRTVPRLAPAPARRAVVLRAAAATVVLLAAYVAAATVVTADETLRRMRGPGFELTLPNDWVDVTADVGTGDHDLVLGGWDRLVIISHAPATGDVAAMSAESRHVLSDRGARILGPRTPIALGGEARTVSFAFELPEFEGIDERGEQLTSVHDGVVYVVELKSLLSRYRRAQFQPLLDSWRWHRE